MWKRYREIAVLLFFLGSAPLAGPQSGAVPRYESRPEEDRDGTGKFYMGREIARVMGHQGAYWLDRPERQQEERTDELIRLLEVRPGDVVADIGAGTGYFSLPLAQQVGPQGRVLAVDIQPEMLEILEQRRRQHKLDHLELILGSETDPHLPPVSVDLALLVDVYHEFSHPWEMMQAICRALKPGGRLVMVEYRAEDPSVPIKRLHKMSQEQVIRELTVHPLRWVRTLSALPRQHVLIFEKIP